MSPPPWIPLVVFALFAAASPAQSDWRGFRGTHGHARAESAPPHEWGDETNLAWRTPLPGPGASSPIIVGDRAFVTCWSGYAVDVDEPGDPADLRRHLVCVGLETGAVAWSRTVPPTDTEDEFGGRMATHGYASNTPVSDGERVYAFFSKGGVRAFELDGEEVWQASVGTGSSPWTTGSGSPLSLWKDLLFVNASDESQALVALDKRTGKEVWKLANPGLDQAYGMPTIAGTDEEPVLVMPLLGSIWGLEPKTGQPLWLVPTKTNGALAPCTTLDGTTLFSLGGQTRLRSYAIRTERDIGDADRVVWSSRYGSYVPTPLVHGDHLYWVNESGIAFVVSKSDGELVTQKRLEGEFYASLVHAGDVLVAVSRTNGTYVLTADPELEVLAHNVFESDDSIFDATPAFGAGDRMLLRSRRALYCIRPDQRQ